MKQEKLGLMIFSALLILIMVTAVSAYSLEFYYFETDKLVYEVGEPIDMVAKIKADFSEDGWCYVSFTIITDIGLVYTDAYFIPPSPEIRYLPSSYILYPNETAPGLIGTQACAIFQIEIYDGISQTEGDTVYFNITRGQVEVLPETPLHIEYGTNSSLSFKITSIYNENITYCSQNVSIEILDINGTSIFQKNTISDSEGRINLLWNSSIAPPDEYNLSISSNGTESFLPFSQSFQLFVDPAASSLNILSCPKSIFCQSSDATHNDSVDLIVEHLQTNQSPILLSNVTWETNFSQGEMTELGNGQYWSIIEFPVKPGLYSINLTATNPLFQTVQYQLSIQVLPRNVTFKIEMLEVMIAGSYLSTKITVSDSISGSGIKNLGLLVNVSIGEINLDVSWKITNDSGDVFYNISIPDTIWGFGLMSISTNESIHYLAREYTFPLNITFIPNISIESDLIGILGYDTRINMTVYNPKGNTVAGVSYNFCNPAGENLLNGTSDFDGKIRFTFNIPEYAEFGLQKYEIYIHSDLLLCINSTSQVLEIAVRIPLSFVSTNRPFKATRGENATIWFLIESKIICNQTVDINFCDTSYEFSFLKTITTDIIEIVNFSIDLHVSLGSHRVLVIVQSEMYQLIGTFEFELMVFTSFDFNMIFDAVYYRESLNFSISFWSDDIAPLSINVNAYFITCNYSFAIQNVTMDSKHFIPLSENVHPGEHLLLFNASSPLYINISKQFLIFVWMKTSMDITLSVLKHEVNQGEASRLEYVDSILALDMASNISYGSIISPPPILFNGTISIVPSTTRATSFESCPRFNSGTNNLSTFFANSLICLSGNGHNVRSRNDFNDNEDLIFNTSCTDLEVHPYEIIPQSALLGPEIEKSANESEFFWILDVIRRMRRL